MNEGKIRCASALGSMKISAGPRATDSAGLDYLGGPIVTAGGIVFIPAPRIHSCAGFDIETGKELWKAQLPAGATPHQ